MILYILYVPDFFPEQTMEKKYCLEEEEKHNKNVVRREEPKARSIKEVKRFAKIKFISGLTV